MKILTAAQLREADEYTIERENLAPGALMERAAQAFTNWFINNCGREKEVAIFCGPGNNGGDGLAVARLLNEQNYLVRAFIPETGSTFSDDFKLNLERLPHNVPLIRYKKKSALHDLHLSKTRIIDALFGTGLNRPLAGLYAETIQFLNSKQAEIISIDLPSGLYADSATPREAPVIQAARTITFSSPKLALLLPQNQHYSQQTQTVQIGLNIAFIESLRTTTFFTDAETVKKRWKPRPKFGHKGTFGHALMLAGSYGKMGAAILATRACLRSGAGLVSVSIPQSGYQIMQVAAPEAMVLADSSEKALSHCPEDLEKYDAIGVGPGLGMEIKTRKMVAKLLEKVTKPLVLDADALNILAADKTLLEKIPPESILTPHPKEFERLTEQVDDDFTRLKMLREFCEKYRCYVVLKGANSCIGTPTGNLYFNASGNPGMATGGAGDVLTGVITALRGQGYSAEDACIMGVYMHGLAGDFAKGEKGEMALIAADIIENLGQAFRTLEEKGSVRSFTELND